MRNQLQVTLRDLAAECGVSTATVSLALNGHPRISAATRGRIEAAARRLKYVPNAHAVVLARRNPRRPDATLALLGGYSGGARFPPDIRARSFAAMANRRGYRLLSKTVNSPATARATLEQLYRTGVEGLFLPNLRIFQELPEQLLADFSVVVLGHYDELPRYHSVHHEIFHSLIALADRVTAAGYRRIFVHAPAHNPLLADDLEREAAFRIVLARFDRGYCPFLEPAQQRLTPEALVKAVRKSQADAVIGFNEAEWKFLRQAGMRIPEEIGFAALHSGGDAITGSMVPVEEITEAAFDLMTSLLQRRETGRPSTPVHMRLAKRWNAGETLRLPDP